ncbi:MAG TPA: GNAT family N-acetyltransferase [Crenalkalicoccus sp.]|nr:GNAT family N-acetyltransferase [Crenalkalicoccus sp.]
MAEAAPEGAAISVCDAAGAPALASLQAACFAPHPGWGADAIALMLAQPGGFALCVPGQGFVLARAVGGEAEILSVGVVPAARRQGLGGRLLAAAMFGAAARGAAAMFLEVGAANVAALALYRAAGFVVVGRRRDYYGGGADALVMRRDLTPC